LAARLVATVRAWDARHVTLMGDSLRGLQLFVARAVWCSLAALAGVLFVAAVVARYGALATPSPPIRAELAYLGLSPRAYALAYLLPAAVFALVCLIVAAMIVRRKPTDAMALFVSVFLLLLGALYGPNAAALEESYPNAFLPIMLGYALLIVSQVLMLFLFLDGRIVPYWMCVPVLVWIGVLLLVMVQPGKPLAAGPDLLGALMLVSGLGAGVTAQVYRYLRVSNAVQRQQTKWVVCGVAVAALGFLLLVLPRAFVPTLSQPGRAAPLYDMASESAAVLASLCIPASIGVAILRHRLWDIDVIINRLLAYGALSATTVGIYLLVVGGLGALFPGNGGGIVSLVAAALIAVLFAPLRVRLQRGVNRLLYGERDEPYAVLSRLGQRIGVALVPDAVLPAIVATVREALKLPYTEIALYSDDGRSAAGAVSGQPVDDVLRLPLILQHETVGELMVGARAPGETFGPADRALLEDLARQAGAAAHAVRLTADLQRSRQQLVTAREEERRRLRRDLHDGLGPALAAQTLKAGCARTLLLSDPAAAETLLAELESDLETALKDIRRLVYSLRPPALDELGLIAAIRDTAMKYRPLQARTDDRSDDERLRITVEAPDALAPLPAAVEVATYRIVQEALTNVVCHAAASTCLIGISTVDGSLRIEVIDDGVGIPAERRAGVGLTSMRERASELGGTFLLDIPPSGGTRVLACLPLPAMTETDASNVGVPWTASAS